MNDSTLALLFIAVFLVCYLILRPFYVRSEIEKTVIKLDEAAKRAEFPDFIWANEDYIADETGEVDYFNFHQQAKFTGNTEKQRDF